MNVIDYKFLKTYPEQFNYKRQPNEIVRINEFERNTHQPYEHYYNPNVDSAKSCYKFHLDADGLGYIETSYFIGIDVLPNSSKIIHVEPKLNTDSCKIDFFKIVETALDGNLTADETEGLFRIDFHKPYIPIKQEHDYLSTLLFAQYLQLLKIIVKKGLRKSYYTVENNLNAKIKGKILVTDTLRRNHFKGRIDRTICSYQEFGLNHFENKLLKKALEFISANLYTHTTVEALNRLITYCKPAFVNVSSDVDENEVKSHKLNPFYSEYSQALELARIILKRFGFKLENATKEIVMTPPFWIDMSKVFELYVHQKLKEIDSNVLYEPNIHGRYPDFLIKNDAFTGVVDAKYKPRYKNNNISIEDKRQISAYARMKGVYDYLKVDKEKLLDCLIIYSDQSLNNEDITLENMVPSRSYEKLYKLGFKLPELSPSTDVI